MRKTRNAVGAWGAALGVASFVGWMLPVAVIGCGGGGDETPAASDATAPTDAAAEVADTAHDTHVDPIDSGADATDGGPVSHGGTTGKPCATSDQCDVTGDGVNQCSADWFAYGSLYPDPVCFGTECAPPAPGKLAECDEGKGWCQSYTSSTRCYPKCSFDADGATPAAGCVGKDACEWIGWTTDSKGVKHGTGICWAGCTADADCKAGLVCQTEYGECVKKAKHWTATKSIGDPCTAADRGTTTKAPHCNCYMNSKVGKGYCTSFCKMGDSPTTCPAGFTCDADLPTHDATLVFTGAAQGVSGACYKNCSTDAECAPLGGYCDENAGTGRKTCQFGVRADDAGVDDGGTSDASDAGSDASDATSG